jgi:hypothetical protein
MASAEGANTFRVLVNYSPAPRVVDEVVLHLASGATLGDALKASGLLERHSLVLDENLHFGIWAKAKPLETPLRADDRVEIWRGLKVDPKEARRQRYHKQPAKGAR